MATPHSNTNATTQAWPSIAEFRELARTHRVIPVVRTVLADGHTALGLYQALAQNAPGTFLLESAHGGTWSRWSFIGVRSTAVLSEHDGAAMWYGQVPAHLPSGGSPISALRDTLAALHSPRVPGLPPLTGGLVGYLGYDAVRELENIGDSTTDELQLPAMSYLLAADMAAVDHLNGTVTLIANAINLDAGPDGVDDAYARSIARLDEMHAQLASAKAPEVVDLPAHADVPDLVGDAEYISKVDIAKEHIRAGDAFQIVLSQRFTTPTRARALDVYRALRMTNPSPYMYYIRMPNSDFTDVAFDIVGSSPEALVKVSEGEALIHPIAGTRPRGKTADEDAALAADLLADEKERAEHLMLVDLGRNDLGRVCDAGSVCVVEFMNVERYSHVLHLVSTVTGRLRPEVTACDVICATFPAGTLSGAPKPRAMQIIEDLEATKRGIYGGCIGYLDFAGDADTAIAIRTAVIKDGLAYVQAGAGIVADSLPAAEDAECRHKAAAVLRAVRMAEHLA
ncbi:MAG: anthranilate synthase component [Actinomycetota bacterium]